jgi:signal transduction histidine kinase
MIDDNAEDLAQVASVLSHDFRGPARHVSGCTDRMLEQAEVIRKMVLASEAIDLGVLEVLVNWARLAQKSAERLTRMIEHVLQYSRAGTAGVTTEDIEVLEVVGDVLRDYADRIVERNVTVKVSMLPVVHYDRTMLYLVLANLISNAIKFSKKDDPGPVVEVSGRGTMGGLAAIHVRDQGIGIPIAHQKKILDMGFRLHHESEYAGFGYGLAIVRRILGRCGGELGVRSRVGDGSEFVVTLPAARNVVP